MTKFEKGKTYYGMERNIRVYAKVAGTTIKTVTFKILGTQEEKSGNDAYRIDEAINDRNQKRSIYFDARNESEYSEVATYIPDGWLGGKTYCTGIVIRAKDEVELETAAEEVVNNNDKAAAQEVVEVTEQTAGATAYDFSIASLYVKSEVINGKVYWYGDNSDNLSTRYEKTSRGCGRRAKTVGNPWKRISKAAAAEILAKYSITLEQFRAYENGEHETAAQEVVNSEAQETAEASTVEEKTEAQEVTEPELTANMKLAAQIVDSLGEGEVKFSHAGAGKNGGLALHYDLDDGSEFGTGISLVEVFTDKDGYILDHVNVIKLNPVKTVATYNFIQPVDPAPTDEPTGTNDEDVETTEQVTEGNVETEEQEVSEYKPQTEPEMFTAVMDAPQVHAEIFTTSLDFAIERTRIFLVNNADSKVKILDVNGKILVEKTCDQISRRPDDVDEKSAEPEPEPTGRMKWAAELLDNYTYEFECDKETGKKGLARHYKRFNSNGEQVGKLVEIFTDKSSFILDHINIGNDKKAVHAYYYINGEKLSYFKGEFNFLWSDKYKAGMNVVGGRHLQVEVPDGQWKKHKNFAVDDDEFFQIMSERGACSFETEPPENPTAVAPVETDLTDKYQAALEGVYVEDEVGDFVPAAGMTNVAKDNLMVYRNDSGFMEEDPDKYVELLDMEEELEIAEENRKLDEAFAETKLGAPELTHGMKLAAQIIASIGNSPLELVNFGYGEYGAPRYVYETADYKFSVTEAMTDCSPDRRLEYVEVFDYATMTKTVYDFKPVLSDELKKFRIECDAAFAKLGKSTEPPAESFTETAPKPPPATFKVGEVYRADWRKADDGLATFRILGRSIMFVTAMPVAFAECDAFDEDKDYVFKAKIRSDERGEYFNYDDMTVSAGEAYKLDEPAPVDIDKKKKTAIIIDRKEVERHGCNIKQQHQLLGEAQIHVWNFWFEDADADWTEHCVDAT